MEELNTDGLQWAISAAFSLQLPRIRPNDLEQRKLRRAYQKGYEAARAEILTILKDEHKRRVSKRLMK